MSCMYTASAGTQWQCAYDVQCTQYGRLFRSVLAQHIAVWLRLIESGYGYECSAIEIVRACAYCNIEIVQSDTMCALHVAGFRVSCCSRSHLLLHCDCVSHPPSATGKLSKEGKQLRSLLQSRLKAFREPE